MHGGALGSDQELKGKDNTEAHQFSFNVSSAADSTSLLGKCIDTTRTLFVTHEMLYQFLPSELN